MWSSIEERHVELMRSKQYFEARPVYDDFRLAEDDTP